MRTGFRIRLLSTTITAAALAVSLPTAASAHGALQRVSEVPAALALVAANQDPTRLRPLPAAEDPIRMVDSALTDATVARVRHRFAAEDCRPDEMRRQLAIINNMLSRARDVRARAVAATISVADLRILDERVEAITEIYRESLARQANCPNGPPPAATAEPPAPESAAIVPSTTIFPENDTDLEALLARAQAYLAAANCQGLNCPRIDCERARRAYQALLEAEDYLAELVRALDVANENAVAAFRSEAQANIITGQNIANTQLAIGVQQYFQRLGSMLLDLASVASFVERLVEPDSLANAASVAARINEFYQAARDAESLGATLTEAITGESAPTPVAGLAGRFGDAQFINDTSATATDVLSIYREARQIMDAARAEGRDQASALRTVRELFRNSRARASLGQIVGRYLKNYSAARLRERQDRLRSQLRYAETEAASVARAFENLQRVQARRWAAIDALAAVREASEAYEVCLSRLCGTMSFERATIPNFSYAEPGTGRVRYNSGPALRYLNAAIQATLPRLVPVPVTDDCPDLPDANTPSPAATPVPPPSPPPPPLPPEAPAPAAAPPSSEEVAPQGDDEDVEDPETASPPPPEPFGLRIFVDGGVGRDSFDPTGIGFQRDGAPGATPERFAVEAPRATDIVYVEGGIQLPIGRIAPLITFGYAEGDTRRDFAIAAGGAGASGVVYGDNAPSGSSGIATGLGLTGAIESDTRLVTAGVAIPFIDTQFDASQVEPLPPFRPSFLGLLVVAGDIRAQDYSGSATFSGGGLSFSQTRAQEIDETRIGVGFGGRLLVPLGRDAALRLAADGLVYYRDTDLTSTERNLCSFCPAADRDFTLNIEDSDNGWGVRGRASAEFEFRLSPRFAFTIGGSLDYQSSVGTIFNPNSGDQVFFDGLRTGLRTGDAWQWRAGAGVRLTFGDR